MSEIVGSFRIRLGREILSDTHEYRNTARSKAPGESSAGANIGREVSRKLDLEYLAAFLALGMPTRRELVAPEHTILGTCLFIDHPVESTLL